MNAHKEKRADNVRLGLQSTSPNPTGVLSSLAHTQKLAGRALNAPNGSVGYTGHTRNALLPQDPMYAPRRLRLCASLRHRAAGLWWVEGRSCSAGGYVTNPGWLLDERPGLPPRGPSYCPSPPPLLRTHHLCHGNRRESRPLLFGQGCWPRAAVRMACSTKASQPHPHHCPPPPPKTQGTTIPKSVS